MMARCKLNPCCGATTPGECEPPPQFKPRENYEEYQQRLAKPSSPAGGDVVREALQAARGFIRGNFTMGVPSSRTNAGKVVDQIDAALSAAEPVAQGADYAGDITPHDDKERGMTVLRDAYDFDIADDGTLCGLVAGDQGWASTHIRIATPPAPAAVDGQRVKALGWEKTPSGFVWIAVSAVGRYFVEERHSDFVWTLEPQPGRGYRNTLDEAKAAAQADFEARIRSPLASTDATEKTDG